MATHSSILSWRVPWTEEPGSLTSQANSLPSNLPLIEIRSLFFWCRGTRKYSTMMERFFILVDMVATGLHAFVKIILMYSENVSFLLHI